MAHHRNSKVLVILCLNRPEQHEKSKQWQQENENLSQHLKQQALSFVQLGKHQLLTMSYAWDCLLLDFNETPFTNNQGVGLARKIAADTALALIDRNYIQQPWIFSTDADVALPETYFDVTTNAKGFSAISLPFKHVSGDHELLSYQAKYDFKMYYYQWGMQHIGVAYDYIPLGSTLVVSADAYATVRGFPIKSGGEDFYLLNKLAKIGRVSQPKMPIIEIQCRLSDRVPFGTGPAVAKYQTSTTEALYYHPKSFDILKDWRTKLLAQFNQPDIMATATIDEASLNKFWNWPVVYKKNIKQIKTEQRWQQFIHEWLDAFKLLKSVHRLREVYPDVTREHIPFDSSTQEL